MRIVFYSVTNTKQGLSIMIKAKIVGAGGYGGVGIAELLLAHPNAAVGALVDVENVGVPISEIYPHLAGFLDTEMTQHSIANIMQKTGMDAAKAEAALAANNPQNRLIQPDEVASAALWLCAPGSEGVNGQAISISGGEV